MPMPMPMSLQKLDNQYLDSIARSFPMFLFELWVAIDFPPPVLHQLDIGDWLQHGPRRRGARAWRGASKTLITIAYSLWRLFRNPEEKVLAVSQSAYHAQQSLHLARQWIEEVPFLRHMRPGKERRDSAIRFDVGTSVDMKDRVASWESCGITGQLAGKRGTLIIADDIETEENSLTLLQRERLREIVKELDRVIKPNEESDIIYLGTPFHESDSLYDDLPKRGYTFRAWPARFPGPEQDIQFVSPLIRDLLEGHPKSVLLTRYPYLKWLPPHHLERYQQKAA